MPFKVWDQYFCVGSHNTSWCSYTKKAGNQQFSRTIQHRELWTWIKKVLDRSLPSLRLEWIIPVFRISVVWEGWTIFSGGPSALEIFWTPQELCEIIPLRSILVISIPRKEKPLAEASCAPRPSWLVRLNGIFLTLALAVMAAHRFCFAFSQKDEFCVLLVDINCLTAVSRPWQASTVVRSSPEVTSYSCCLKPAYPDQSIYSRGEAREKNKYCTPSFILHGTQTGTVRNVGGDAV